MPIQVNGRTLETDEEGFLVEPSDWDHDVADHIAGLELTNERWEIVEFVRHRYEDNHSVPEARTLLKALGKRHGATTGRPEIPLHPVPLRLRPAGLQDRRYAQAAQADAGRLTRISHRAAEHGG